MRTTLHEVSGVVGQPVDRVAAVLLAAHEGPAGPGNAWLLREGGYQLTGGPTRFTARSAAHSMTVEVGPDWIATQGGWWYRGEYALRPDPRGTLVTHRVSNVAQRGRWAVPLANRLFRGFSAKVDAGFTQLLADLDRAAATHG